MTAKQKIVPCLWFDSQAEEAAKFYTKIFGNSKILQTTHYGKAGSKVANRPEGSVMTVTFLLDGLEFMGLNGGPIFKMNPSISFHVKCKTKDEVDELWKKLSGNGKVLMQLGEYPFSERYGWVQDKFGVSWQLIYSKETKQRFTPMLMFVGDVCGRAKEAIDHYISIFRDGKVDMVVRYAEGEEPDKAGTVKYAHFWLLGLEFGAMDSAREHKFAFNEAISLMIYCKDQKEIDYFWSKLSKGGEEGPCGWLKDKFGLSWQVVPEDMDEMMKDHKKSEKAMEALLSMKKLDLKKLKEAAK